MILARLLALAVLAILIGSCSSDSPSSIQTGNNTITSGVYLFDDGSMYRYVQIPNSGIIPLRSRIAKDADFVQLTKDSRCLLKPETVRWKAGNERWIRLHEENVYLDVASRGAEGQLFLSFDETDEPDFQDSSAVFYIHQFGTNGNKLEVCIESMRYPGNYLSNVGNTLSGNAITLLPFASKEQAPRILIHQINTTTVIGR